MQEQHAEGDVSVRGGARNGELNVRISYKFSFPPPKLKETAKHEKLSPETRNVSAVRSYPHRTIPNVPLLLAFQEQNITISHKDKTTKRRQLVWTF